ncbi:MAG: glycosyltransferase family 4 protein [Sporichthyaceae bacterium]|nr:glycosyltransferase family 4 protein [Sporichthyaceae bacterium]
MAPRVLVDATAVPADRGGLGRYVDGLIAALASAGADLAVVCQRADAERCSRLAPQARVVAGPAAISHRSARLAWEQAGLPLLANQLGAEVIHEPYYTMPLRASQPVVVTIHDVTVFSAPEIHAPVRGGFYRSAVRTSLHRAARCLVPSQATRDELVRVLGADPDRIDVAYHGVDTVAFHRPDEQERRRVSDRLGLHGLPYVAFLGEITPRKNVSALVRGWATAVSDLDQPPALVLAGYPGWDGEVDRAVAEVPSHLRVVRPGYLRPTDLSGYLGGALVVGYPSQSEGFGLPVLEAMACGAPVLATRRLSLPEVGGEAVAYTEPDPDSIAIELKSLLADDERRRELGDAGFARAAQFTWSASAQAHLEAYARAAGALARPA